MEGRKPVHAASLFLHLLHHATSTIGGGFPGGASSGQPSVALLAIPTHELKHRDGTVRRVLRTFPSTSERKAQVHPHRISPTRAP